LFPLLIPPFPDFPNRDFPSFSSAMFCYSDRNKPYERSFLSFSTPSKTLISLCHGSDDKLRHPDRGFPPHFPAPPPIQPYIPPLLSFHQEQLSPHRYWTPHHLFRSDYLLNPATCFLSACSPPHGPLDLFRFFCLGSFVLSSGGPPKGFISRPPDLFSKSSFCSRHSPFSYPLYGYPLFPVTFPPAALPFFCRYASFAPSPQRVNIPFTGIVLMTVATSLPPRKPPFGIPDRDPGDKSILLVFFHLSSNLQNFPLFWRFCRGLFLFFQLLDDISSLLLAQSPWPSLFFHVFFFSSRFFSCSLFLIA